LRLSLGGIGIGLKRKFVKQTKINSRLAHEGGFGPSHAYRGRAR
jgi:hypothetical protein